ncbi:TRIC cation channel family protein [Burkholderia pyrrocinia]|uniref:TRIC cation channel family protein n=1 Tax=Burkholderia pyrrocinia TaxID=60550 RepID=UPI001BCBD8B3|nr:TRIC cation channel family protein [Burkholderia pyrrocinia]QVN20308.1 TRIC cation channel family protein [Burkholderia pyrrocinia]
MKTTTKLVPAADLAGTAVFAIEGAVAAMRGGLDLLGVMVVAFTVALGGGGRRAGLPPVVAAVGAGTACFALRLTAVRYGWQLPRAQL